MTNRPYIAVIGGGAGGVFCAIETKRLLPSAHVVLFEKTAHLLSKVRISGGGRCNVTHAEFDPKILSQNYPRGNSFLLPLFYRFQPKDTITWFEKESIFLVKEEDGRMFPSTNSSETIISCFLSLLEKLEIEVIKKSCVTQIEEQEPNTISLTYREEVEKTYPFNFQAIVVATGSTPSSLHLLQSLHLNIISQVPSLFTFNIPSSQFLDLAGVSIEKVALSLPEITMQKKAAKVEGPLLITHWGFSGPAILKLSSLQARTLFEKKYKTLLHIDWAPSFTTQELSQKAYSLRNSCSPGSLIKNFPLLQNIPRSLFERFMELSHIPMHQTWGHISNSHIAQLIAHIKQGSFQIEGKTTYKNEFVTAGGVDLKEISPKSISSKRYPWLFFTGEVLDIDGVTGGFNFQAAWTTAWIASRGIYTRLSDENRSL